MIRKNIDCINCIYSKYNIKNDKIICSFFKFEGLNKKNFFYTDIDYCRKLKTLCGEYAKYFQQK